MSLPILHDSVERRLSLELENLLNRFGFTGKHLEWASKARERCLRISAQSGPRSSRGDADEAADRAGIEKTVRFAVDYCSVLEKEYWRAWSISKAPCDDYVPQLDGIKTKVDECASHVWEKRTGWYQGACRSRVEVELSRFVAERVAAARTAEIDRLKVCPPTAQDEAALIMLLVPGSPIGCSKPAAQEQGGESEAAGECSGTTTRRRGRPSIIPIEQKLKALDARRSGDGTHKQAKLWYGVKNPTTVQLRDITSSLNHFEKSQQKIRCLATTA